MMTEERREDGISRVPVRRPVALCAGREGTLLQGKTRDLSPRGMSVEVEGPLSPGDHLVFRLDLGPDYSAVVEGGQVAWALPGEGSTEAGVRFVPLQRRPSTGQLDPVVAEKPGGFRPGEELRVKVGGMSQALRAEFVDQDGSSLMRFRCPLPFLRLRSAVVVHGAGDEGATFEGEVGAVEASARGAEGIPELLVTVWAGSGDGDGDAVVMGTAECAGISMPPRGMASRDTLEDAPDPVGEPVIRQEVVETRDTLRERPTETSPRRLAIPIEEPASAAREPEAEPSAKRPPSLGAERAAEIGRTVGTVVGGAGKRFAAAASTAARTGVRRAGPVLAKLFAGVWGALCAGGSALFGLFGGVQKKWRRSHLPRTYSDVVGRTQRPETGGKNWVHRAALAMGVVGVALAMWGIFGTRGASGKSGGAAPPTGGIEDTGPAAGAEGAPLPEVPSAWPSAGGLPSPAGEPTSGGASDWGVAGASAPDPETPSPVAAAGAPARPSEPSDREARGGRGGAAPAVREGGRTFVLQLDKPALRVSNYGLREPPGIVIDVLGAGPVDGETRIETGSNAVRLVKATPRADGTRFIIYLRARTMPRFTIAPNGSEIQVTIHN